MYDEAAVAPLLDTLAAEWGGEVAIGSYPVRLSRLVAFSHCCSCVRPYTDVRLHVSLA